MSKSLISSFGEQCEWIAQVAHKKWAMWANHSGRSPKMSHNEWFAQVAHQKWTNEQIACFFERIAHSLIFLQKKVICSEEKTDERIPSPDNIPQKTFIEISI